MYEAFYGLREKPFSILPDPDLIYWGRVHKMAYAMLQFGLMNSAGFTVITGEIGSGKTTLVRNLVKRLDSSMTTGVVSNTPRDRDELLRCIMMSLNQPIEGDFLAVMKRFRDFLLVQRKNRRGTLVVVDEAQNLGVDALEELRMLSNVNTDKDQYLQLILVGQPQLREKLRSPQLIQFAQRVSSDFHLKPLDEAEVPHYIDFRLKAVGANRKLFADDAAILIARATGGIPRMINILCDTALVYGFSTGTEFISAGLIREVIADKQTYGVFPVGAAR
jgi:type II secretory pathway predicted ATPase ExeA